MSGDPDNEETQPTRLLRIARTASDALRRHAQEGYPHEVVGILVGSGRAVSEVVPLVNERADSPANRYLVDGLVLMKAEKAVEARGLQVLGYYHSHPDHPSKYSDFDRDQAMPNLSYLIVSVMNGVVADSRSWRLREDRSAMDEEALELHV